jgi:hypothetical protein
MFEVRMRGMKTRLTLGFAAVSMVGLAPVGALPIQEQVALLEESELMEGFAQVDSGKARMLIFERMMEEIPGVEYELVPVVRKKIPDLEKHYLEQLKRHVPAAYRNHLAGLSDEQIHKIQYERRKWRSYIEKTASRQNFKTQYFDTAVECVKLTLPNLDKVLPQEAATAKAELEEFLGYLESCRRELDEDEELVDPTVGKKSPTGHPYPTLDRPRTERENLEYLESSIVLALTVAPEGANPVLMKNAEVAREIDYEEGEFVLLANQIRMFAGSIVWAVDPLTCACARDHSNDRKQGLAKGHMSTVPGKHGMADRCRYWGTSARSEGAGGGKGKSYLRGLSYDGTGHTGPLYGQGRNVIGIGIRGGAATSMYRTDERLRHPCAVTEKEGFMPPGLTRRDVSSPVMRAIYTALRKGDFLQAHELLKKARVTDPVEQTILRFFKAAVEVETEWRAEAIAAISRSGDVYCARNYLEETLKKFGDNLEISSRFTNAYDPPEEVGAGDYEVGRKFHRLVEDAQEAGNLAGDKGMLSKIESFAKRYPGSIYAEAALYCLNDGKEPKSILAYFLDRGGSLINFGYPGGEF